MNKEEFNKMIKEYLTENLSVFVGVDCFNGGTKVSVSLYLDNEKISCHWDKDYQ